MIQGSINQLLPVTMRDATTGQAIQLSDTQMNAGECNYSINGNAKVNLSFVNGAEGAGYSPGVWIETGTDGGQYFYGFPDACWATAGSVAFEFIAAGALLSAPFAIIELDWVRLGVDNTYTNTFKGTDVDAVTVTNT